MSKRIFLNAFTPVVLATILALSGCSGDKPAASPEPQTSNPPGETASPEPAADPLDDGVLVVDQSGNGEFTTVQEALLKVPRNTDEPVTIYIKKGVYDEKLYVFRPNIRLIGESLEETIITHNDNADSIGPTGQKMGTKGSATVTITANGFYAENLTFQNTNPVLQAVALYVESDKAIFNRVRIIGDQDTLYANGGRQYYKDSYIEGTTDFIFGAATAVFDNCVIHSKKESYITAASTPEDREYGYVFRNCKLTVASSGVRDGSVYLGRPWRHHANVIFYNTEMGPHIKPEGWHNWDDPTKEATARYAEYGSTGPGANPDARVSWSRQLTDEEAAKLTLPNILGGNDGWDAELDLKERSEQVNRDVAALGA